MFRMKWHHFIHLLDIWISSMTFSFISLDYFPTVLFDFFLLICKRQLPDSKANWIKLRKKFVSASLHYQSNQTQLRNKSSMTGRDDSHLGEVHHHVVMCQEVIQLVQNTTAHA